MKKARSTERPAPTPSRPPGRLAASGAAALSGALYFLAFPGVGAWPLAFVALVPLELALRGQSPRRSLWLGWLSGIVMTLAGFHWLYPLLESYGGFPSALCLLLLFVLSLYQGGRMALLSWLHARAGARGWPRALCFGAAFLASELWMPLLFPWYFGATMHAVPAFVQIAELGGPILVGLVLVTTNLAVAECAALALRRQGLSRAVVAVGVVAPLVTFTYGALRISAVDAATAAAPRVRVGIVQPNLELLGRNAGSLALHYERTRELVARGAELVVWSEAAVQNRYSAVDYAERIPREIGRHLGVPTVIGTVLFRQRPGAEEATDPLARYELFNVAVVTDETGALRGRYDKQYLLPFGEYLPLAETFPFLRDLSPHSGRFSPGPMQEALPVGGHRLGALICYEDILPSFVNELVRREQPEMLVNLTNDTWFGDTAEPWIHLALASFRAIEQRKFLVRATNSGVSAIVDPVGRVTLASATYEEQALLGTAGYSKARTVFSYVGQTPLWIGSVWALFAAFLRRPRDGERFTDVFRELWRKRRPRPMAPRGPGSGRPGGPVSAGPS